jgi:RNA polymerase sigma-70 factor (ECF subfamily)
MAISLERTDPALLGLDAPARASGAELSDEELVVALRRGDRQVGRILYQRLVRVIDATLSRVIGPGQPDHDDLVQAAFEEVVRTLFKGQFKGRCRLTSWAASIACHLGLNAIRSRRTERGIFDRSADVSDSGLSHSPRHPEIALEARDELKLLRTALATLSPGRAEAVLLHDAFGYDLSEVAELTNSTEAAVQSRLVRGRRDLSERLPLTARKMEGT